ncbi:MAG: hypothetical protein HY903_01390 [Deltaproteobacteria bacterium]|nr:hypothetical protein [Deltaproteobacteria bacterium]
MVMLILSIVALGVGPGIFLFADHFAGKGARVVLEILTVIAVGGITVFQILPEILEVLGWMAMIPLGIGLLGPSAVERSMKSLANPAHVVVRVLVVVGLGLHEFLDGMALSAPQVSSAQAASALPWAVVLHRLSIGLVLWWLVRPRLGGYVAAGILAAMGIVTVGGYCTGEAVLASLDERQFAVFEALVAGSLLHVVVHSHDHHGTAEHAPS